MTRDPLSLATSALGESMLRLADIAAFLGVALPTVKRWRAQGTLPAADFVMGGVVRWRPETIRRWAATRQGVNGS